MCIYEPNSCSRKKALVPSFTISYRGNNVGRKVPLRSRLGRNFDFVSARDFTYCHGMTCAWALGTGHWALYVGMVTAEGPLGLLTCSTATNGKCI